MATTAAAAVSAMLLARERDLPLYSDDRAIRAFARGLGLRAFGTFELVVAALQRGILTEEESQELRDAIIDLGVWVPAIDPGLYVAYARRMNFDLGRCLRPLLADEVMLRADPRIAHNALLLVTIADEAPDELQAWATAILDSYRLIVEADPMLIGSLILAAILNPDKAEVSDADRARAAKIIEAIRNVPGLAPSGSETDPLVGAVRRWAPRGQGGAPGPYSRANPWMGRKRRRLDAARRVREHVRGRGRRAAAGLGQRAATACRCGRGVPSRDAGSRCPRRRQPLHTGREARGLSQPE